MRINNLGYLIKEGIRGIFLHGFMSFAAVCVTVACLLIVGSFTCLTYNFTLIVEDLNKTNEILVIIDENIKDDAEARSIGTQINRVENVYKATFVHKDEAFESFVETYSDTSSLTGVDTNFLRHRFVVVLEDNSKFAETIDALGQIEGVAKISAARELAEGFTMVQNVLQIASVAVVGLLLVVSLLIISNTVKLAMYDRREEIAIMKMVGATNSFIRLPYVVEGFTLGILGAGIAFGVEWFLYELLRGRMSTAGSLQLIEFVPFQELLLPMILTFFAAGVFVGIVGSWTSIRKFMDV